MLPEFELLLPQTLSDALRFLTERGNDIFPIAGGTNLIIDMRAGKSTPKALMNINRMPGISEIHRSNGTITIGGATTISDILHSPIVTDAGGSLHEATCVFASPLVRNRATVGGNLSDGSPAADTAPSLLVLDAEVELSSSNGTRILPLNDYFVGVRKTKRNPNELLTAVRWNAPSMDAKSAFFKLGLRKADAISVVSAAVFVDKNPDGTCKKARIALGSVAPCPLRVYNAEEYLVGKPLDDRNIDQAAKLSAQACSPISDVRASAGYRQRMVEVLVCRLLKKVSQ